MENKLVYKWGEVTLEQTDSLAEICKHIQEILELHPDAILRSFDDDETFLNYVTTINYSFKELETDEEARERVEIEEKNAKIRKEADLRYYNEIKIKYNL